MGKVRFFMILIGMCMMNINSAHSSASSGIHLYMNGQEWHFLENPIRKDTALNNSFQKYLPQERYLSVEDPDSYSAKWEVVDNELYLRSVEIRLAGGNRNSIDVEIPEAELRKFFTAYNTEKGILATWLNGKISIGKGKHIPYPNMDFPLNYEDECELIIIHGIIVGMNFYHNSYKPGTCLYKEWKTIENRIPWDKFPKLKNKKIILSVYDIRLTPDRYFDSGEIMVTVDDKLMEENHPFIKSILKVLKEIPDWEMYHVKGVYNGPLLDIRLPIAPPSKTEL